MEYARFIVPPTKSGANEMRTIINNTVVETITVKGIFGDDQQIDRMSFITQWTDHVKQLYSLNDYEAVNQIVEQVEKLANARFDQLVKD